MILFIFVSVGKGPLSKRQINFGRLNGRRKESLWIEKADWADCESENLIENEISHLFGNADGLDCDRKHNLFLKNFSL